MTYLKLSLLAAVAILGVSSLGAQNISYDFNSDQTDFNTKFVETTAGGTWITGGITATGGVNNTGYLATSSATQNVLFDQAATWAVGQTYNMSVYFKARVTATTTAGGLAVRLGIGDDIAATLYGAEYVAATIVAGATADSSRLALVSRQASSPGTVTTNGVDLGVLADNNWYQLTASFTKNAITDRIDATISLYNWGTDGITGGSQLGTSSSISATGLTNVYGSSGNYFGIGGHSSAGQGGVRGLDNFTVTGISAVPEPSTYAAIAGLGVLGLAALRRRRAV